MIVRLSVACSLLFIQNLVLASDEIEQQVKQLAGHAPKDVRLAALKRLRELSEKPEVLKALSAVEACARDEDAEVRSEGVTCLAVLAFVNKQPCPLAVAQALLDMDTTVRESACMYLVFESYPKESLDVLLKAIKHDDPEVRSVVAIPLATAGKKDKRVIAALRKATSDKDLLTQHNAHIALYKATDDLKTIVPHWLRCAGYGKAESRKPGDPDADREQVQRDLMSIGSVMQLREHAKQRPAELAAALKTNLSAKDPLLRRVAARILGASAGEFKEFKAALPKLKVADELQKLQDDADESVRLEAAMALRKIEE